MLSRAPLPRSVGLVGLVLLLHASPSAGLVKLRALLGAADWVLGGQEYVPQWCLLAHGSSLELCGPTVLAPRRPVCCLLRLFSLFAPPGEGRAASLVVWSPPSPCFQPLAAAVERTAGGLRA